MTDKVAADTVEAQGWQDRFKLRSDLMQPDLYAFEKAIQKHGGIQLVFGGGTVQATHAIYAAIDAGWIATPETSTGDFTISQNGSGPGRKETRYFIGGRGIHEMPAGMVIWYGTRVTEAYREAVEIPPN